MLFIYLNLPTEPTAAADIAQVRISIYVYCNLSYTYIYRNDLRPVVDNQSHWNVLHNTYRHVVGRYS